MNLRFAIDSVPEFWSLVTEVAHRCGILSPAAPRLLEERLDAGAEPTMAVADLFAYTGTFTMVIDSYERLGPSVSMVDDALLQFIESVPAASAIIATRGGTKLAAEGLHIRDRVRIIDDSHLAFTEDEIDALLEANDAGTSVESARDVLRATGGYPLAVRAVIATRSHGANILGRASLAWGSLVADELRSQLPDASTARFVALTALAPYLDVDLAIRLTGRQDAEGVLNSLAEQGFGRWIPYLGRRSLFEYVQATRQAFAHDLQHDASASRRANATAARWLFEKCDNMAAFELAITAEDYALAVRIAFELLQTYPDSQSTTHILDQLERVPHRVLRDHPVLAFALGMAQLTHPVLHTTAPQLFRLALRQRVGDRILGTPADRFIAAGVRAVSLRLTGHYPEAARLGEQAIAELDGLPPAEAERIRESAAVILRYVAFSMFQDGQYRRALTTLTRSGSLSRVPVNRDHALAFLLGVYGQLGDGVNARVALRQLEEDNHRRDASTFVDPMRSVGQAYLRLDEHDPGGAIEELRRVAASSAHTEFWPLVAAVRLHANLALGRGLTECRRVEEMLRSPVPPRGVADNVGTRTLMNMLAIGWLAAGRVAKAESILAEQGNAAPELVPARIVHALTVDRLDHASDRLAAWLAPDGHTTRTAAAAHVLGAVLRLRQADEAGAVALLQKSEELYRHYGVAAHLDLVPAQDREALVELAEGCGFPGLAERLVQRVHAVRPAEIAPTLTKREIVVLEGLAATASREAIAGWLCVSTNTVKSQLRSIYRKLGVSDRAGALRLAIEHELIGKAPDLERSTD